ncbi:hypothetical protein D3C81_1100250 [compost metagenome]
MLGTVVVQAGGIQATEQLIVGIEDRRHRAAQARVGCQEVLLTVDGQGLPTSQSGADAVGTGH